MWIAKLVSRDGGQFFEVLKVGGALFDKRPGWILLGRTPGSRKQDVFWVHPDDITFEWVRQFCFKEN